MHKSQSLFYLTTALHVSGVTITHLQEQYAINIHGSAVTTIIELGIKNRVSYCYTSYAHARNTKPIFTPN